ncbi:MAG: hypothetical protein P3A28_06725 [Gemmatimonadota bacterium]|nr:hypothetical protein [Gemmatimonadota bacterium]
MRILALLPDDSERALRRVLNPSDTLRRVFTLPALTASVSAERVDAIVFDPTTLGSAEWAEACSLLEDVRLPVLLYAPLSPAHAPRLVQASAVGVHEMLLRDVDDDPVTVRRRLESLRMPEPPAAVLSLIAPRMVTLPAMLQSVIVPLFCAARIPRWVDGVAQAAGMPRRSIDRWMARAEIGGTATLLDVARLARVWAPLVDRHESAAEVAVSHGYRRVRILADHTARIVGVSPSAVGVSLSRKAFVERLAAHATRG